VSKKLVVIQIGDLTKRNAYRRNVKSVARTLVEQAVIALTAERKRSYDGDVDTKNKEDVNGGGRIYALTADVQPKLAVHIVGSI
jgi:hypothetical protein